MLNRFLAGKQQEARGERQKRPYLASECLDLAEADKWRQQILREIGKKVMEIQNAGLGEHRWAERAREVCPVGLSGQAQLQALGHPPAAPACQPLAAHLPSCYPR